MAKKLTDEEKSEIYAEPDDGMDVARFPDVVEEEVAKEYHYARLPKDLIPFVEYQDKFFSPAKQREIAEKRKLKISCPLTLDEALKKELTSKGGFQIGPLMRRAICEIRPKTISDLEAMDFQHTDMNPVVIEKYGKLILSIVARFEAPPVPVISDRPKIITSAFDLLILREKRREAAEQGDRDPEWGCPNFSIGTYSAGLDSPKYELVLAVALSYIEGCLLLEDAAGKPFSKWTIVQRLKSIDIPLPAGYEEYEYLTSGEIAPSFWEDAEKYVHLVELRHRVMEEE